MTFWSWLRARRRGWLLGLAVVLVLGSLALAAWELFFVLDVLAD